MIEITLKWSKKTFNVDLDPAQSPLEFMEKVRELTGVPVGRQKLLAQKGGWKGSLKEDSDFSTIAAKLTKPLVVTLIGSAEVLEQGPTTQHTFIEDLTPEELRAEQEAQIKAALASTVAWIPALQKPPHQRSDKNKKAEWYPYNHYVAGLPQQQIQSLLLEQKQRQLTSSPLMHSEFSSATGTASSSDVNLVGRVAMSMGMELRRSYVNDLAVLPNGALVSALDDGHVQLWKEGILQDDVVHEGDHDRGTGVDRVIVLNAPPQITPPKVALATAGRGVVRLWSHSAAEDTIEQILCLPASPIPGATSPASLVQIPVFSTLDHAPVSPMPVCLAARFQVTRQPNPHQFRLEPQTEEQRRRRAQAEAQEQLLQEQLGRVSKMVQVWFSDASGGHPFRSVVLEPRDDIGAAPTTSLVVIPASSVGKPSWLIVGDVAGGLRFWKVQMVPNAQSPVLIQEHAYFRLTPDSSNDAGCSVVCMEALPSGELVVSTDVSHGNDFAMHEQGTNQKVSVPFQRAVYIFECMFCDPVRPPATTEPQMQILAVLRGHTKDGVQSMLSLPNGDLLTAGGKLDATLQLWKSDQLQPLSCSKQGDTSKLTTSTTTRIETSCFKNLKDVGYVFALAVLEDLKDGSNHFAVAAARYNQVKVIL